MGKVTNISLQLEFIRLSLENSKSHLKGVYRVGVPIISPFVLIEFKNCKGGGRLGGSVG